MLAAALLVLAPLVAGHLGDGAGREPFLVDGALVGGGTAVGLVERDEAGVWRRACEEASGGAPLGYFRASDGVVLAATLDGVLESDDGGCSWAPAVSALRNFEVSALARARGAPEVVYAATSRPGFPNGVWRSDDGGRAFVETALAGVIHPLLDLAVSSDGAVVVVTGADLDQNAPLLLASANGGATFAAPSDPSWSAASYLRVRALLVDDSVAGQERVWLSLLDVTEHAWLAWASLDLSQVQLEQELTTEALAMARIVAANGAGAHVVHARSAVYRRAEGDALFAVVDGVALGCLRASDALDALYGCGVPGSGVQFWSSADGIAWTVAVADDDLVARTCPSDSAAALLCPADADAGVSDAGAGDAGTSDAGPRDAGTGDAGNGDGDGDDHGDHGDDDDTDGDDDGGCAHAPAGSLAALALCLRRRRA